MELLDATERLAKIHEELEYRRKVNPLAFHELLPMQQAFADDPAKNKGVFGGNRSGKTEGVADYVVRKGLKKRLKIWVCGETFQDSIAIQQPKIWNLLPKQSIRYGHFDEINGFRHRKVILKIGTVITFKSYDQGREAFQSDDIDLIWNDEEPPLDIVKEQKMRLIDRDGEMILSMTSLKGITELLADVYNDHEVVDSQYAPLIDKEVPRVAEKEGYRFYFLWATENPHISQSRITQDVRLMSVDEITARIYGVPINLQGKIYPKFSKKHHVIRFEDLPEGQYALHQILDPHDRKPWAIMWGAVYKDGTCYVIDEYPNKNFNEMLFDDKTTGEYAKLIKERDAHWEGIFGCKISKRIIDPNFGNKTVKLAQRQGGQASTTVKRDLAKNGLIYQDGIDALEDGHLKVREYLHWETKGDEYVVRPNLYVVDTNQNTIRHLSRYSRKDIETADGDVRDKAGPQEKYKDFCDCTRYWLMSNPVYRQEQKQEPEQKRIY